MMPAPKPRHTGGSPWLRLALVAMFVPSQVGCLHMLMATGIYMFQGGNLVPAECEALEGRRVVVYCRPPVSQEFRQAGASRAIASRVTALLSEHVKRVTVTPQSQVDSWVDENDSDQFLELGKAVKAEMLVEVELGHFELFKGKTVYQGNADVTINVYDIKDGGKLVWSKPIGEVLYPVHSPIAVQDKTVPQFQRDFVEVISQQVAMCFYDHDPSTLFAIDAVANG